MLINFVKTIYSSHWILLSSFSNFSFSSLDVKSPSSPCLLFVVVLLIVYKLLRFVFSCIVVGFSGQILVILTTPNKMFFLVRDKSRAFSTQLAKVILSSSI